MKIGWWLDSSFIMFCEFEFKFTSFNFMSIHNCSSASIGAASSDSDSELESLSSNIFRYSSSLRNLERNFVWIRGLRFVMERIRTRTSIHHFLELKKMYVNFQTLGSVNRLRNSGSKNEVCAKWFGLSHVWSWLGCQNFPIVWTLPSALKERSTPADDAGR